MKNRTNNVSSNHLVWFIYISAAVFILAVPASGQYKFMVKPMVMELTARPGQTVRKNLELRNSAIEPRIIDLQLVDLSQWDNGKWKLIDPNSDIDTSKLSSCREWIEFKSNTVRVPGLRMVPVTLTIKVPPKTRGFYCVGLIAKIRPKGGGTGAAMVLRFLVPVLIEIQSRAVRHKVSLADIGMEFSEQTEKKPSSTLVLMSVANEGKTYSKIGGSAILKSFSGGHWRAITEAKLKEISIVPGVTLNLKSDIARSLPSGKYKLMGRLYVDGRRTKPLEKEIDFVGDPTIKTAAADAPLELKPAELFINSVPGATRSAVLKVHNASDAAVDIAAVPAVPQVLSGVAFGELRGEDLVCTQWLRVVPNKFTLRAGRSQNIRIISKMPKTESMHPNYYANLNLWARYQDGQNAGVTTALVGIENGKAETKPAIQPMKLTIAAEEESRYVVVARFGNIGNVHIIPRCSATLTAEMGTNATSRIILAGSSDVMLPLEVRDFSGFLDFSKIKAGQYIIEAILEYTSGKDLEQRTERVGQAIPIRVSEEDGRKVVEIIGPKEELAE